MGGFGGGASNPWGSPAPTAAVSAPPASAGAAYTKIHSEAQYHAAVKDAGTKLVVVDVSAEWCRPCKMIEPVFVELAQAYRGKVVFLKIDGDECRSLAQELGVTGYPTFLFFVQGSQVDKFSGADERRLRSVVAEYGDRDDMKPCPYKHFPLKDSEQVKYADMKWSPAHSHRPLPHAPALVRLSRRTALRSCCVWLSACQGRGGGQDRRVQRQGGGGAATVGGGEGRAGRHHPEAAEQAPLPLHHIHRRAVPHHSEGRPHDREAAQRIGPRTAVEGGCGRFGVLTPALSAVLLCRC